MSRLVVVSNRIAPPDEHAASAGGLAVGILGALKAAGGLWFGWSGETGNEDQPLKKVKKGNITWASFNLSEQDLDEYYNQFSNAVLWPAFHYRLDLVQFQRPAWDGYLRVNALLADKLLPLLQDDDIIWIHDYHLLPFAHELRKRGVNNRIGFFLHIPFPTPEILHVAARSEHALVIAPTGSGKTLAAFLYALDRLFREGGEDTREAHKRKTSRILYISPIKALGTDVQRNLQLPFIFINAAEADFWRQIFVVFTGQLAGFATGATAGINKKSILGCHRLLLTPFQPEQGLYVTDSP